MAYDDDELVKLFVEESLEHIITIGNDLLQIEAEGAAVDADLINRVFRAVHSIKGGIGIMDLAHIARLAHGMETVISKMRSREIVPDTEIVNALLFATDNLNHLLMNIDDSNSIDIDESLNALESSINQVTLSQETSSSGPIPIGDTLEQQPFSIAPPEIERIIGEGKSFFIIFIHLQRDDSPDLKKVHQLFSGLQNCGEIIDCQFDFNTIGTLTDIGPYKTVPFSILFASSLEVEIVQALSEIGDTEVYAIEPDELKNNALLFSDPSTKSIFKMNGEGRIGKPALMAQRNLPQAKKNQATGESDARTSSTKLRTRQYHSLRVSVDIIDNLMNLAAEFVLGRNQLLQSIGSKDFRNIEMAGQRIDTIATKLQETIMLTRLQPIGTVFNKFPRIVRDLAGGLGKKIKLKISGENVELDKTILEAIGDPLTHMVRNAIDHGIESPEVRREQGKSAVGTIQINAYHEAGQVCVEIMDDGKGMDGEHLVSLALTKQLLTKEKADLMSHEEKLNLIFLPGFSTSDSITSVSGRGVGMDVVKNNLDKLGGIVKIHSQPGKGTLFLIKLPLTLAIIPCQIVVVAGERYAIPQVSLDELIGIQPEDVKHRIEKIGNAEVVRVRESLLPLIRLADLFKIQNDYFDKFSKSYRKDRRGSIVDRRALYGPARVEQNGQLLALDGPSPLSADHLVEPEAFNRRMSQDRRYHVESMVNIVIVNTGLFKYGIIVDKFYDPEEIVVKPLGRHFKKCQGYAGATIMGDGRVALILDALKIAQMANLVSMEGAEGAAAVRRFEQFNKSDLVPMLLFRGAEAEYFTVPLGLVERIEKIQQEQIEVIGGKRVVSYKGRALMLYSVDEVAQVEPIGALDEYVVLVFSIEEHRVGLLARLPVDAVELDMRSLDSSLKQPGIMGSLVIGNRTTMIVDILDFVYALNPGWCVNEEAAQKGVILLVDDSDFSRSHVRCFLTQAGFSVIEATDGLVALESLEMHQDAVRLIVTDLSMPHLDGFLFSEKVRLDPRFETLPIIALTNGYSEEEFAQCNEIGINEYHVNFDRKSILQSVRELIL